MRTRILLSSAIALGVAVTGCAARLESEPVVASAGPPPPAPVVVSEAPPPPPAVDDDLVYDVEPPAVNVELYPSVVYEGTTVYYVGGVWYRRGLRGWARYRAEPEGLTRVRVAHGGDARWAHEGAPRPPAPGAAEMQRRSRPAPRREVPR